MHNNGSNIGGNIPDKFMPNPDNKTNLSLSQCHQWKPFVTSSVNLYL